MSGTPSTPAGPWARFLRGLVLGLAFMAGVSVIGMMLVTCVDVVGRSLGYPLKGSYDIVRLLSLITLSCALPYTTAVKGHVAVEFFFHKMPRPVQIILDSTMRLLMIGLFGLLTIRGVEYGFSLRESGEVMLTLGWPIYWGCFVMAFGCAVSALVVLQHLLHPRKVLLSP